MALGLTSVVRGENQSYSEAEKQIFLTNHLANLGSTATVHYDFAKSGTLEAGVRDKVSISVSPSATKKGKHVSVSYLTGERKLELPDIEEAEGNPVILFFLERDVREMHRITGGQTNYYRNRIRLALVEHAEIQPVIFKYDGRDLQGKEIRIDPYRDDPVRSRFEKFANKRYIFTLSDQVPGGVFQLRTVMSPSGGDPKVEARPALIDETLTLSADGD